MTDTVAVWNWVCTSITQNWGDRSSLIHARDCCWHPIRSISVRQNYLTLISCILISCWRAHQNDPINCTVIISLFIEFIVRLSKRGMQAVIRCWTSQAVFVWVRARSSRHTSRWWLVTFSTRSFPIGRRRKDRWATLISQGLASFRRSHWRRMWCVMHFVFISRGSPFALRDVGRSRLFIVRLQTEEDRRYLGDFCSRHSNCVILVHGIIALQAAPKKLIQEMLKKTSHSQLFQLTHRSHTHISTISNPWPIALTYLKKIAKLLKSSLAFFNPLDLVEYSF